MGHYSTHSWPEVRCTVVVPQRPGCLRYWAKIWRYCVTTLIIHNHSDGAVYFTFIELTSSVLLAELLVETSRQSVEHGPLFKGIWKTTLEGRPPSSLQHAILSLCSGTVLSHYCSTLNNPTFTCSNRHAKSCYCRALLSCYSIRRKYSKGEFTLIWSTEWM